MAKQAATIRKRETAEAPPTMKGNVPQISAQEKPKGPLPGKISRKPSKGQDEELPPAAPGGKPEPSDFPREMRGGVDVDPGTFLDYRTVYTAGGQIVKDLQSMPKQSVPKSSEQTKQSVRKSSEQTQVVEDGNLTYCHYCRKTGDLSCCDGIGEGIAN